MLFVGGIILAVIVVIFFAADFMTKKVTQNVLFEFDSAQNVPDGIYTGTYEIFPVKVVAAVTVSAGEITNIELIEHRNGLGKKAERILDDVIQGQNLNVDAISGATLSSKTILKSIEDALKRGK
jgi:uncharacterized protein with FMN-binding domain